MKCAYSEVSCEQCKKRKKCEIHERCDNLQDALWDDGCEME